MKIVGIWQKIARWIVFVPARALDLLAITLMAIYTPYFWFKVRGKGADPITPPAPKYTLDEILAKGLATPSNQYGFTADESHALLCQGGNIIQNPQNRALLYNEVIKPSGTLYRKYPDDETWLGVSGDALSSATFALKLAPLADKAANKELISRMAKHYLDNCFGLTWDTQNGVSNRSSNGGFSVVVDGWPVVTPGQGIGLAQPITGPAFLTGQALFDLAASEVGGIWHLVSILHFLLLGGIFHAIVPVLYIPSQNWYYTHQISSLNLWTLCKTNSFLYRHAMKWVVKYVAPGGNMQPFIAGLAWNVGCLSEEDRQRAIATLCAMNTGWPQDLITSYNFTTPVSNANFSVMSFAAAMLKNPIGWMPE